MAAWLAFFALLAETFVAKAEIFEDAFSSGLLMILSISPATRALTFLADFNPVSKRLTILKKRIKSFHAMFVLFLCSPKIIIEISSANFW